MTGEERKAWEELVERNRVPFGYDFAILAADAELTALRARIALLEKVAEAAIVYDDAIRKCTDDPDKMASYCTATGDGLDELYFNWMTLSRAALAALKEGK
jgi:hypothetical protein